MIAQLRPGMYRQSITLPITLVAKIRTVIRDRRKQIKVTKKVDGELDVDRPMTVSDFMVELAEKELAGVEPGVDEIFWMAEAAKKTLALRARADALVADGINRKPKSEWKKRGRVAGKSYPKIDAAMAALGEKRKGTKRVGHAYVKPDDGQ